MLGERGGGDGRALAAGAQRLGDGQQRLLRRVAQAGRGGVRVGAAAVARKTSARPPGPGTGMGRVAAGFHYRPGEEAAGRS